MIKVKELIRLKGDPVWTISPKQTARVAIRLLAEKKIGALPVIDNAQLVGIVTERDIIRFVSR